MTRRIASFSKANIVKALCAAKQTGAEAVEVRRDGTIVVLMKAPTPVPTDEFEAWEREHEQTKAARRSERD
jgi:hypothetical protein